MWPLIDDKEGEWYPAGLPAKSVEGMEGYRVFLAMGLILVRGRACFMMLCKQACDAARRRCLPPEWSVGREPTDA